MAAKYETGELAEVLRLAQRVIDLSEGDATKGNLMLESPLAFCHRAAQRELAGPSERPAWHEDIDHAMALARPCDPVTRGVGDVLRAPASNVTNGVLLPSDAILREAAEALPIAEQCGQDVALAVGRKATTRRHPATARAAA